MKRPIRACRRDVVTIEQEPARPQQALLQSHLRPGGEATAHSCPICLVQLRINPDQLRPAWHQCPTCQVVLHEVCLFGYMSQHADEFPCPNCRTKYTHDSVEQYDEWNADDIIDALLEPDEDFIDNSVSPNASAGKRRCARFAA